MKLLLTGHTSAVGQEIVKHFDDYELVKVSRATGFDLLNEDDINRVVELAQDVDHVINLANVESSQSDLLYKIHRSWQNRSGRIISFGTLATDVSYDLLKHINADNSMLGNKLLLEKVHAELSMSKIFGNQPQSVLLRFANYGKKNNNRVNEPSTSTKEMMDILRFVLESTTYISSLDFRNV